MRDRPQHDRPQSRQRHADRLLDEPGIGGSGVKTASRQLVRQGLQLAGGDVASQQDHALIRGGQPQQGVGQR